MRLAKGQTPAAGYCPTKVTARRTQARAMAPTAPAKLPKATAEMRMQLKSVATPRGNMSQGSPRVRGFVGATNADVGRSEHRGRFLDDSTRDLAPALGATPCPSRGAGDRGGNVTLASLTATRGVSPRQTWTAGTSEMRGRQVLTARRTQWHTDRQATASLSPTQPNGTSNALASTGGSPGRRGVHPAVPLLKTEGLGVGGTAGAGGGQRFGDGDDLFGEQLVRTTRCGASHKASTMHLYLQPLDGSPSHRSPGERMQTHYDRTLQASFTERNYVTPAKIRNQPESLPVKANVSAQRALPICLAEK